MAFILPPSTREEGDQWVSHSVQEMIASADQVVFQVKDNGNHRVTAGSAGLLQLFGVTLLGRHSKGYDPGLCRL